MAFSCQIRRKCCTLPGFPVSAVTTAFLSWVCPLLQAREPSIGVLVLFWDKERAVGTSAARSKAGFVSPTGR